MKNKFLVVFMIFLFSLSFISAFAVSTKYWEEKPLQISPGETKKIEIVLQNLAGESDIRVEGQILEGSDFVKFEEESTTYSIPLGTKISVFLIVDAPKNLKIDQENIVVSFNVLSDLNSGEFGFGMGVERQIPLEVIEGNKFIFKKYIFVILFLIALPLLFFYFRKKRK